MNERHDPMAAPDHLTRSVCEADPYLATGVGPATTAVAVPLPATQRYSLGDEIARGGMGIIYRATDTTLGREVAVKVLQDKYGPESGVALRFADEARITSQLQHPSIPPVHDLGTLPDGRPFLAMKLIKGQTLEELLKDRPDPGTERGRFVAVFEQICQALAYAHSHQVIHRDLKPANVMVGNFGEVQVMDWGLAKVLASRGLVPPVWRTTRRRRPAPRRSVRCAIRTARSRRRAACWARRRSCRPSRRSGPSARWMPAATCSGWGRCWRCS